MPLPISEWTRYHVTYKNDRPRRAFTFDIELDPVIIEGLESNAAETKQTAQMYVCAQVREVLNSNNFGGWRDGHVLWRNFRLKAITSSS